MNKDSHVKQPTTPAAVPGDRTELARRVSSCKSAESTNAVRSWPRKMFDALNTPPMRAREPRIRGVVRTVSARWS